MTVESNKVIKKYRSDGIIYDMINITKNNRSNILIDISINLNDDISYKLKELGLIQLITVQGINKWTLTLKGIAHNIMFRDNIDYEEQYKILLNCFDDKFEIDAKKQLDWKEKLATLTLILMASTSEKSVIVLDNPSNREIFEDMLNDSLSCLIKHGVIKENSKLPRTRGEPPATLLMRSRINDLPTKTNHVYVNMGGGDGYYHDIEYMGQLDENKLYFLLKLVFDEYNPDINYKSLKNELISLSEKYSPQMLSRNIDSRVLYEILNKIEVFFNVEIYNQPLKN